jgi:non-heme chloroperoxidase
MKTHRVTGGNGVQRHVVETGNERGRPILFIHGLSQCWLRWCRQMDSELAKERLSRDAGSAFSGSAERVGRFVSDGPLV